MTRAELAELHQNEWREYRQTVLEPCRQAFEERELKTAKTLADAMRIMQDGERRAWDFGEGRETDSELTFVWEDAENGAGDNTV